MTAFPRTVTPFEVSDLDLPGPLISKAQSGRVNLRSTQQIGYSWTERYLLRMSDTTHRDFLAVVRNLWRNGTIFTIAPIDYATPRGQAGGSPLVNAATQLVTDPENFGAWSLVNTPVLTAGQADPLGGTAAYLMEDNNAASNEGVDQTVTFTGDGTKAFSLFIRGSDFGNSYFGLRDSTAGVWRHLVRVTWSGGIPSLVTVVGGGVLFTPEQQSSITWWRVSANADSVVAANANRFELSPADTASTDVGLAYFFGANAWNEVTPARYAGPSQAAATTGADIYVNGGTASQANWLRAGDIIRVAGVTGAREIPTNITTQANGYAIVPVNPSIYTGNSPADNAAITISGVTLDAVILEPPNFPTTSGTSADYGELTLRFSEAL